MSRDDNLMVLRRLRSEGRINDEEYRELTERLGTKRRPVADVVEVPAAESPDGEPTAEDELSVDPLWPPRLRHDRSPSYIAALAVASLLLIVLGALGLLSWWVSLPAILLLATTLFEGWRVVTILGVVGWGLLLVVGLAFSAANRPPPAQAAAITPPAEDPVPPVPGSLGIYMDQFTELWNFVDAPPRITQALNRYDETGRFDTFLYRFGDWARVAGAYEPGSEAIYALYVTGSLSGEATDQLYVHLCYLVAPFSPDCIDSYHEHGLAGDALADFTGVTHQAEWALDDLTWRLEIEGNVLTIRVFGADAI